MITLTQHNRIKSFKSKIKFKLTLEIRFICLTADIPNSTDEYIWIISSSSNIFLIVHHNIFSSQVFGLTLFCIVIISIKNTTSFF